MQFGALAGAAGSAALSTYKSLEQEKRTDAEFAYEQAQRDALAKVQSQAPVIMGKVNTTAGSTAGPPMSLEDYMQAHGASPEDIARVGASPGAAQAWLSKSPGISQSAQDPAPPTAQTALPSTVAAPGGGVVTAPQAAPTMQTVNDASLPPAAQHYVKSIRALGTNAGAPQNVIEAAVLSPMLESGYNSGVKNNGSSTGFLQQHPDTFKEHGGTNINDPEQQIGVMYKLLSQANTSLTKTLGRPPTPQELALTYQQGAAGGPALLHADPNADAAGTLNSLGYYQERPGQAHAAIRGNNGSDGPPQPTAGQFIEGFNKRAGKYMSPAAVAAAGPSSALAAAGAPPAGPADFLPPTALSNAPSSSPFEVYEGTDGKQYVTNTPMKYTASDANRDMAHAYRATGTERGMKLADDLEAHEQQRHLGEQQIQAGARQAHQAEAWQLIQPALATGDADGMTAGLNKMASGTGTHYVVAKNDQTGMYAIGAYSSSTGKLLGSASAPMTLPDLQARAISMFSTPEGAAQFRYQSGELAVANRNADTSAKNAASQETLVGAEAKNLGADADRTTQLTAPAVQAAQAAAAAETTKTAALTGLASAAKSGNPAAVAAAQATAQIINGQPPGMSYAPAPNMVNTFVGKDSATGQTWLIGPAGKQPIEMALNPSVAKDPDVVAHNIQGGYAATVPGQPPQVVYYVAGAAGKFGTFQAAKAALVHIRSAPKPGARPSAFAGASPNFAGAN